MSADLDARLRRAVENRDKLASEIQRIEGKKEAAQKALLEIETEIRSKGLDPDNLEKIVADLKSAYESEVLKLETGVSRTRELLTPYLG